MKEPQVKNHLKNLFIFIFFIYLMQIVNNTDSNITNIYDGNLEDLIKPLNLTNISIIDLILPSYKNEIIVFNNNSAIEIINNITKISENIFKNNSSTEIINNITKISENIFKYNSSTDYYKNLYKGECCNDVCCSCTTEFGADVTLSDRSKEFMDHEMLFRENKSNPNISVGKSEINVKLLNNSKNISTINKNNLKVLKCFKKLFSKEGLKKNTGNYILLSLVVGTCSCVVILIVKECKTLDTLIDQIIAEKKIKIKISLNNKNGPPKAKKARNSFKIKYKKDIIKESSSKIEIKNKKFLLNNNETFGDTLNNKGNKYNDLEMNTLEYEDALKIDRRTYIEFYFSLFKRKQILVFTFYTSNDYNLRTMKINLLLFSFAIDYTVNTLFFNDDVIHRIKIDEGKYTLLYRKGNLILSFLISNVCKFIIKYFSLTEKNIIEMKNSNDEQKNSKNKKCIKIKIILFFVFNVLILLFFWYYISCFCAIYLNTQMHLLKDTLISFGTSLLYPIALCFLPGIFRIPSLRAAKKDKNFIYKISKLIGFVI